MGGTDGTDWPFYVEKNPRFKKNSLPLYKNLMKQIKYIPTKPNDKGLKGNLDKFLELQEDLNYKIGRWWSYTRLGSWWLDFRNGIKQLFKWRKIIYQQCDWDYNDMYDLMEFKIKLLKEGIERRDLSVGVEDDVKWMNTTLRLIDKVKTTYYQEEYYPYHESNWEFIPLPDNPKLFSTEFTTLRDDLDTYFQKYPKLHKQMLLEFPNSESRSFIASSIGDHMHNKARKLLFKIITDKIEYWWD